MKINVVFNLYFQIITEAVNEGDPHPLIGPQYSGGGGLDGTQYAKVRYTQYAKIL